MAKMAKKLTLEQLVQQGLEKSAADNMLQSLNQLLSSHSPSECWQKIYGEILTPDHPFQLHKFLYETVFSDWDSAKGPPPAWFPSEEQIQNSNIASLMKALGLNTYEELHEWSAQNRADFWELMIRTLDIRLKKLYTKVMDISHGVESPQWLMDAKLNIADSCFNAPKDAIAITAQTESGTSLSMTYRELDSLANRVANALVKTGLNPGDAIGIDMPMTAESVAIYLGIVKAGCVVISIADSFAPEEIKMRLRLADAKAIFTQDYIRRAGKLLPLYAKVVSANAPKAVVLLESGFR